MKLIAIAFVAVSQFGSPVRAEIIYLNCGGVKWMQESEGSPINSTTSLALNTDLGTFAWTNDEHTFEAPRCKALWPQGGPKDVGTCTNLETSDLEFDFGVEYWVPSRESKSTVLLMQVKGSIDRVNGKMRADETEGDEGSDKARQSHYSLTCKVEPRKF